MATTLIEELRSAASEIACHCRDFGKPCRRELEAARLRERADHIEAYLGSRPGLNVLLTLDGVVGPDIPGLTDRGGR